MTYPSDIQDGLGWERWSDDSNGGLSFSIHKRIKNIASETRPLASNHGSTSS